MAKGSGGGKSGGGKSDRSGKVGGGKSGGNPDYPSTTGRPSGGDRGNAPKGK